MSFKSSPQYKFTRTWISSWGTDIGDDVEAVVTWVSKTTRGNSMDRVRINSSYGIRVRVSTMLQNGLDVIKKSCVIRFKDPLNSHMPWQSGQRWWLNAACGPPKDATATNLTLHILNVTNDMSFCTGSLNYVVDRVKKLGTTAIVYWINNGSSSWARWRFV